MEANSDKSNLIISCKEATTEMIDSFPIDSSKVIPGITISHDLKFDDHVNYLCKKAGQNLMHLSINVLVRIALFMNVSKEHIMISHLLNRSLGTMP